MTTMDAMPNRKKLNKIDHCSWNFDSIDVNYYLGYVFEK